jgi:hypothetical protein
MLERQYAPVVPPQAGTRARVQAGSLFLLPDAY